MKISYLAKPLLFLAVLGTCTESLAQQDNIIINKTEDSFIELNADTDNVGEYDNAYIKFGQDGDGIKGFIGTVGNYNIDPLGGTYNGGLNNSLLLGTWHNGTDDFPALQFGTGNNVRMTIIPNGNVGIGTINPTANLQVSSGTSGNAKFILEADTDNNNEADNPMLEMRQDGGQVGINIGFDNDRFGHNVFGIGRKYQNVDFWDTFTINTLNGNIGIGTTAPSAKLHINNGDNNYGAILAQANENNFQLYTKTLTTQPTNVESFRIGLKYLNDEQNGFISFYRGSSTSGGFLGFSTNGTEQIRVNSNGNVGIGTTTPDEKLAVNGNIHAKEVRVDLVGWPDYVFTPNYNLPSLEEVKQHIDEKGHLPNMPTATKVAENGINLGEMNAKLLRKIEELTLYILKQEERLNKQEIEFRNRIEKLENK